MEQQTYQRPPSSKQPRGMRPPSNRLPNGTDIAVPTKVDIKNMPMSHQGLPTANTSSGTRRVADSKYYIGILRQRINETMKEITRLQGEIDTRRRGQAIQVNLNEEVSNLRQQIAQSEAELADYNVLADRLANKVALDEMQASLNELQISNSQLEKEADRLYREKKDLDSIVTEQENQVQEMMRGSGSPQLQEMAKEIESLEAQCNELRGKTGDLQGKSREQLLQMVKDATQKIGDLDRQIQDENKNFQYVQNHLKVLQDREADLQTDRGKKFITLRKREQDMSSFIQNFPQQKVAVQEEITEKQKAVLEILNKTARDLESLEKMPTIDNYKKLQEDLEYKRRQMTDAQSTAAQLQAECEQRRRELDDLQNVDQKIRQEHISLQQQMDDMKAQMPQFMDVETIREDGELRKQQWTEERDSLKSQLRNLKKATNAAATKYNEGKAALRTNEVHQRLHQLEKDIKMKAQENATYVEYIEDDRRKTNYAMVKRQALAIVNDINASL